MAATNTLDLGGYGVVIHPALQNDPPYENDPYSYITKVFYRKKDYDDLRKKKRRLAKILGSNEGYQFMTYEREWLGRNLPPKVYELLEEELALNEPNTNYRNTQFYPIRMLHLGKTLKAIQSSPHNTQQARNCSVEHVIASILKVYETVASLAAHRTVHGDVHAENLLIYLAPPYCDMTLIDYDLFETHEEVKKAYEAGRDYMYGPPEVYSLLSDAVKDPEGNLLRFYSARLYRNKWLQRKYPRLQDLQVAVEATIQQGDQSVSLDQMDSFPLSLIILDVIDHFYPSLPLSNDPMLNMIRDVKGVVEKGASLTARGRLGPDEIVKQIRMRLKGTMDQNQEDRNRNKTRNRNRNKTRNQKNKDKKNKNKNQEKNNNQTKKNQKNKNSCVVSGGKQGRRPRM